MYPEQLLELIAKHLSLAVSSLEALANLHGTLERFGSNLMPVGQAAIYAREQTVLLRDLNRNVQQLTQGTSHPNTRYAHTELAAAFEVGTL